MNGMVLVAIKNSNICIRHLINQHLLTAFYSSVYVDISTRGYRCKYKDISCRWAQ